MLELSLARSWSIGGGMLVMTVRCAHIGQDSDVVQFQTGRSDMPVAISSFW